MRRTKRVLECLFFSLLLLLSAASAGYSYWTLRDVTRQLDGKDFLDLASKSVESAYALLQKQQQYERLFQISLIATGCCIVFLLLWFFLTRSRQPKTAQPEAAYGNETISAPSAEAASSAETAAAAENPQAQVSLNTQHEPVSGKTKLENNAPLGAADSTEADETPLPETVEAPVDAGPEQAEASETVTEPVPEEQTAFVCPSCGKVFAKPVKFCSGCGARMTP